MTMASNPLSGKVYKYRGAPEGPLLFATDTGYAEIEEGTGSGEQGGQKERQVFYGTVNQTITEGKIDVIKGADAVYSLSGYDASSGRYTAGADGLLHVAAHVSLKLGGRVILSVDDVSDTAGLPDDVEGDVTLNLIVDVAKGDIVEPKIEAVAGDVTINSLTLHLL